MSIANVIQSPETKLRIATITRQFDSAIAELRNLQVDEAATESFIKTYLVPVYAERVEQVKGGSFNPDASIEAVVKKTRAKRTKVTEEASTDPGDTGAQIPVIKKIIGKTAGKTAGADMM